MWIVWIPCDCDLEQSDLHHWSTLKWGSHYWLMVLMVVTLLVKWAWPQWAVPHHWVKNYKVVNFCCFFPLTTVYTGNMVSFILFPLNILLFTQCLLVKYQNSLQETHTFTHYCDQVKCLFYISLYEVIKSGQFLQIFFFLSVNKPRETKLVQACD